MNIQETKDIIAAYQSRIDKHQEEAAKHGAYGKLVMAMASEIKSAAIQHGAIGFLILQMASDHAMLDFWKEKLQKLEDAQNINN